MVAKHSKNNDNDNDKEKDKDNDKYKDKDKFVERASPKNDLRSYRRGRVY